MGTRLSREQLEKLYGHLDIFEGAMRVIEGIEDASIVPEVIDYTGTFEEFKQGKLNVWHKDTK